MKPQPVQHDRIGDQTIAATTRRQSGGDRLSRVEFGRPDQRPGVIHRTQFDQLALPRRSDEQGPHLHDLRQARATRGKPLAQRGGRRLGAGADLQVAAENLPTIGIQAGVRGCAQRAYGGNDGNPETQTEQHDPQTAHPAAQLSPRQPKCQHQAATLSSTRPSAMCTRRAQRAASSASWVISSSAAPVSVQRVNSRSMTISPVS